MKYEIYPVTNGVLIARITAREARKFYHVTSVIFFIIAVIGAYSMLVYKLNEDDSFKATLFVVFGGMACVATLIYSSYTDRRLRRLPEAVIFNDDRGVVEIKHNASVAKKIEIPYNEISSISPRLHVPCLSQRISYWPLFDSIKFHHLMCMSLRKESDRVC